MMHEVHSNFDRLICSHVFPHIGFKKLNFHKLVPSVHGPVIRLNPYGFADNINVS